MNQSPFLSFPSFLRGNETVSNESEFFDPFGVGSFLLRFSRLIAARVVDSFAGRSVSCGRLFFGNTTAEHRCTGTESEPGGFSFVCGASASLACRGRAHARGLIPLDSRCRAIHAQASAGGAKGGAVGGAGAGSGERGDGSKADSGSAEDAAAKRKTVEKAKFKLKDPRVRLIRAWLTDAYLDGLTVDPQRCKRPVPFISRGGTARRHFHP